MRMNEPASALDLDLGDLSDNEVLDLINKLRGSRLSDIERSRKTVAAKSVGKVTGTKMSIKHVSLEDQAAAQIDSIIKASGEALPPEMRQKLIDKLVAKSKASKK